MNIIKPKFRIISFGFKNQQTRFIIQKRFLFLWFTISLYDLNYYFIPRQFAIEERYCFSEEEAREKINRYFSCAIISKKIIGF